MNNIIISRFSIDGFISKQQPINKDSPFSGMIGCWVFIRGAECNWSLNHNLNMFKNPDLKLWTSKIPERVEVLDFLGNIETVGDIFQNAIKKCQERNHFNLDHEDAGFFIPEKECKYIDSDWYECPEYIWKFGTKGE